MLLKDKFIHFLKSPFFRKNRTLILMVTDGIIVNCVMLLTFLIRFGGFPSKNFVAYEKMFFFILIIRLSVFYYFGLYRRDNDFRPRFELFYDVIASVTVGSILILAMTFINRSFSFPRSVTFISYILNIIAIYYFRVILEPWEKEGDKLWRVAILGFDESIYHLIAEIEKSPFYKFEGIICEKSDNFEIKNYPVHSIKDKSELNTYLAYKEIDILILADKSIEKKDILSIFFSCEKMGIHLKLLPTLYDLLVGRSALTSFLSYPLIDLVRFDEIEQMNYTKRIIDFFISLFLVVLLAPAFLIIAVLIKFDSPGPVFFLQRRVGLKGKEFLIFKFRTMFEDAEAQTGPVMAREEDPRITKIGRILRKYRLDELPQLWNVLWGEMSLVGPRPERVEFVREFSQKIEGYQYRFLVRPGITGLAQVRSSYDLDPENKLRYDLAYISNWNLALDLEIMIETLKVVIFGKGAK